MRNKEVKEEREKQGKNWVDLSNYVGGSRIASSPLIQSNTLSVTESPQSLTLSPTHFYYSKPIFYKRYLTSCRYEIGIYNV